MLVGSIEATLLILLVVVTFGPIITERFRIPGLIGLIFGGVIVGPYVLGWVGTRGLVADLGAIGILYLMFLAGLSFDVRGFLANRNSAVVYGLLGFFAPFLLSLWVSVSFLELTLIAGALVGAMWASNTLVAYPDVRAAGLQANSAVSAAVSAGVVADLLSLTVLAMVTTTAVIDLETESDAVATVSQPTLPLWIALPVLIGFTLWLLPKITAWFFVNVGRTRRQRFVFALAGMAAGATVALIGGIEGLIGAFLAGLGMNRLIPVRGLLMDRLDFVGVTFFIPAFMVSIGLSIDPGVLFDLDTLQLALLFTALVVAGKTTAAMITARIFRFSWHEAGLMSTLSFGQAASTLAIAQVGVNLRILEQDVVNAAVLTIVFTALLTSYGTRFFIRLVPRPVPPAAAVGETLLVDVRPSATAVTELMAFAGDLARPDGGLVIPFAIPRPGDQEGARSLVAEAASAAAALGHDSEGTVRVDESFVDGTVHLIAEDAASALLLGWDGPRFAANYLLGNDIDILGERCPVPMIAAHLVRPWQRIIVATGSTSTDWRTEDALLALAVADRLRRGAQLPLVVMTPDEGLVDAPLRSDEGVDVHTTKKVGEALIKLTRPDDLILATAHAVRDASPITTWHLTRSLADANVAIIAGPHRLVVSKAVIRRDLQPTGNPTL